VLGSIAGDNTILLVLREDFKKDILLEQLCDLFPSVAVLINR
ncbi:MAG: ArgR family transcriptional regulator, partial [Alistipes sp.]|nr:ArgR family transcriptional regulator [Alistipes sp.]